MSIYKTDPHKLHRVDSPGSSKDAAHRVDSARLKQLVYDEVKASGEHGITGKEICKKHPDIPYSSITARPKSLEEDGLIYYRGDRRDGARVMRAKTEPEQSAMSF